MAGAFPALGVCVQHLTCVMSSQGHLKGKPRHGLKDDGDDDGAIVVTNKGNGR